MESYNGLNALEVESQNNESASLSDSLTPSTITPETALAKCKSILETILGATVPVRVPVPEEPPSTGNQVLEGKTKLELIQELIDGKLSSEDFMGEIQKVTISEEGLSPHAVQVITVGLPFIREALAKKELEIEGIKPPSLPLTNSQMITTANAGACSDTISTALAKDLIKEFGCFAVEDYAKITIPKKLVNEIHKGVAIMIKPIDDQLKQIKTLLLEQSTSTSGNEAGTGITQQQKQQIKEIFEATSKNCGKLAYLLIDSTKYKYDQIVELELDKKPPFHQKQCYNYLNLLLKIEEMIQNNDNRFEMCLNILFIIKFRVQRLLWLIFLSKPAKVHGDFPSFNEAYFTNACAKFDGTDELLVERIVLIWGEIRSLRYFMDCNSIKEDFDLGFEYFERVVNYTCVGISNMFPVPV